MVSIMSMISQDLNNDRFIHSIIACCYSYKSSRPSVSSTMTSRSWYTDILECTKNTSYIYKHRKQLRETYLRCRQLSVELQLILSTVVALAPDGEAQMGCRNSF